MLFRSLLPASRPEHRAQLDRQHMSLGPSEIDIGFAGRQGPSDAIHLLISTVNPGDKIIVEARYLKTVNGHVIGRLAAKTALEATGRMPAVVTGIMVRTREQTPPEFLATVKTDRWEVVVAELVVSTAPTP